MSLAQVAKQIPCLHNRIHALLVVFTDSNSKNTSSNRIYLEMVMEMAGEFLTTLQEYGRLRKQAGAEQPHFAAGMATGYAMARSSLRLALDGMDADGEPTGDVDIPALVEEAERAIGELRCYPPETTADASGNATKSGNAASLDQAATLPPGGSRRFTSLAKAVDDYAVAIGPFFDLAAAQFKEHNNSDFDGLEFLVRGLKARHMEFAQRAWEIYGDEKEFAR